MGKLGWLGGRRKFFPKGSLISRSDQAAMSSDGVEAHELSAGSTDSIKFFDFIRGSLLPCLRPFPDTHSILIMDNCSIHHVEQIKDFLDDMGVLI